jgi:hypothetical protein
MHEAALLEEGRGVEWDASASAVQVVDGSFVE